MNFPEDFCNSSIKRGKRVFRTRLPGGRRLFVTYQWGKPQPGTQPFTKLSKNLGHQKVTKLLDNSFSHWQLSAGNAEGASVPRR